MRAGELISFDTDLIGPMGFYNDISRSWVVGEEAPDDEQRRLYDLARRQLEHNIALLRPGAGFMEYAEKAFPLPAPYLANRYADIAHGCGLGVEYPLIWYPEDAEAGAYDGVFEEDMVVCVECYRPGPSPAVGLPPGRQFRLTRQRMARLRPTGVWLCRRFKWI
jgi:Xaa-Pro aminopeptidase